MAPFCSCPASLVSRICFAVGPGCAKCFLLLRSVGRRDLSAGPELKKKKNTTQGVFFLLRPGERQGKEKPRAGTGPEQKKKTPPRVCFLLRPRRKAREGEDPLGAGTGPEQKKTPPRVFFFLLRPRGKAGEGEAPLWPCAGAQRGFSFPCLSPGPEPKKKTPWVVFFLLGPCAGAQRVFSFPCLSPGPQQKKTHPGWCFFFCSGPVPAPGFSFPCLSPGPEQKKTHPGWCFFFFAAAPRGRSLTQCGPGWRCLPLAGVFFFFCCGPARTGVFFFFFLLWPRPDAHSLTVGWGDFGKARVVFFLLRPRRVFLDNSKKCLGYYIGSKKTRRGHSKKKKHHFQKRTLLSAIKSQASPTLSQSLM